MLWKVVPCYGSGDVATLLSVMAPWTWFVMALLSFLFMSAIVNRLVRSTGDRRKPDIHVTSPDRGRMWCATSRDNVPPPAPGGGGNAALAAGKPEEKRRER